MLVCTQLNQNGVSFFAFLNSRHAGADLALLQQLQWLFHIVFCKVVHLWSTVLIIRLYILVGYALIRLNIFGLLLTTNWHHLYTAATFDYRIKRKK